MQKKRHKQNRGKSVYYHKLTTTKAETNKIGGKEEDRETTIKEKRRK